MSANKILIVEDAVALNLRYVGYEYYEYMVLYLTLNYQNAEPALDFQEAGSALCV